MASLGHCTEAVWVFPRMGAGADTITPMALSMEARGREEGKIRLRFKNVRVNRVFVRNCEEGEEKEIRLRFKKLSLNCG